MDITWIGEFGMEYHMGETTQGTDVNNWMWRIRYCMTCALFACYEIFIYVLFLIYSPGEFCRHLTLFRTRSTKNLASHFTDVCFQDPIYDKSLQIQQCTWTGDNHYLRQRSSNLLSPGFNYDIMVCSKKGCHTVLHTQRAIWPVRTGIDS